MLRTWNPKESVTQHIHVNYWLKRVKLSRVKHLNIYFIYYGTVW